MLAENLDGHRSSCTTLKANEWSSRQFESLRRRADLELVTDRRSGVVNPQVEVAGEFYARDVHGDDAAQLTGQPIVAHHEHALPFGDPHEGVGAVAQAEFALADPDEHNAFVVRGVGDAIRPERLALLEGEVASQRLTGDPQRQVCSLGADKRSGGERKGHRHLADVERLGNFHRGVVDLHAQRAAQRNVGQNEGDISTQ